MTATAEGERPTWMSGEGARPVRITPEEAMALDITMKNDDLEKETFIQLGLCLLLKDLELSVAFKERDLWSIREKMTWDMQIGGELVGESLKRKVYTLLIEMDSIENLGLGISPEDELHIKDALEKAREEVPDGYSRPYWLDEHFPCTLPDEDTN